MTVGELIEELAYLDESKEIVIAGANGGGYVDSIRADIDEHELSAFWGDDYDVYVLKGGEQVGAI